MNHLGFAKVSALALLALWPARADELPPAPANPNPPMLGFFDGAKALCAARSYDAAHLKAHPQQKVTGIAFAYEPFERVAGEAEPQPMWDQYAGTGAVFARIVVVFRDDPRAALGAADCRAGTDAATLRCGIEGDGGGFTVTKRPDGRYRIDNPQGFSVEYPTADPDEPNDGYRYVAARDDQASFLLDASAGGLCDTRWE
ncbi:MAG: hypothetical protein IT548_18860 [Alphaproteobacteria bacterium]|nr:hypothetical protein [Alphaproteobacteria bacterium]